MTLTWIRAAISVLAFLPATMIAALLWQLRRAGRPDRLGEAVTASSSVFAAGLTAAPFLWPDTPPYARLVAATPVMLLTIFAVGRRVRRNPEALFSPHTIARFPWLRRKP